MDTGTPGAAVIRAIDAAKIYGDDHAARAALRGVTFDLPEGALLAVMGRSGSGKSTLLHLVGGLATPTSGDILLDGRSLTGMDDRALTEIRRHELGFVFQAYNLVPVLSVAENIALPAMISGQRAGPADRRVDELLELLAIGPLRDRLPAQLSGGEQQRVAIARALVMSPRLLLADEPTGSLDSETADEVLDALIHVQRQLRQTVMVVTHDPVVACLADDVMLLQDGIIRDTVRFVSGNGSQPTPVGSDLTLEERLDLLLAALHEPVGRARAAHSSERRLRTVSRGRGHG